MIEYDRITWLNMIEPRQKSKSVMRSIAAPSKAACRAAKSKLLPLRQPGRNSWSRLEHRGFQLVGGLNPSEKY